MLPFASLLGRKRFDNTAEPGEMIWAFDENNIWFHDWVVPAGVYEISAVLVSGGGRSPTGASGYRQGGNGADLRWVNFLPVTPGETLRIKTGQGETVYGETARTDSYIERQGVRLVTASVRTSERSSQRETRSDGSVVGGGNGGLGGYNANTSTNTGGGPGGAGGYSGDGGNGESQGTNGQPQTPYSGQGGGGAGGYLNDIISGQVGLRGEGASGTIQRNGNPTGEQNGSREYGEPIVGYAGGGQATDGGGYGGVRIVWGNGARNGGRAFPMTHVASAEGYEYRLIASNGADGGLVPNQRRFQDGDFSTNAATGNFGVRLKFPGEGRKVSTVRLGSSSTATFQYRLLIDGVWGGWISLPINGGGGVNPAINARVQAIDFRYFNNDQSTICTEFAPTFL